MKRLKLLTLMAMFTAFGTYGSTLLWFPAGIAKAYPVQHALNVIAAVLLGPIPAVIIAFVTSLLRNLLGTGSLLAFPGSMIGALLAGYLFYKTSKPIFASVGEIIGTGVIASLVAVPYASILLGTKTGALFYMPSFAVSSITGSVIGYLLVARLVKIKSIQSLSHHS
ncbi:energy coupling factor transporter S component ThiW [Bacillus sp. B1-b2]|uniref:energy coupling factor transporter S component ThiW n=1 Tax=Bacillus sp. B1-b2 TaxID=2653201 RepID=UPI001261C209|nr:energy coupling factor transporter S component ThiW [Bacillus sp. B1-b2]KAB7670661.1 energy coupling factor transporter S component ThiW [Bacillus sp. B1-b2]